MDAGRSPRKALSRFSDSLRLAAKQCAVRAHPLPFEWLRLALLLAALAQRFLVDRIAARRRRADRESFRCRRQRKAGEDDRDEEERSEHK